MKESNEITLLIVDDEASLRDAIVSDFKKKGFKVLEAVNGQEAFKLLQSHPIDTILSDIKMPGGSGIELLANVTDINPEYPSIILLTGFAELSVEDAYEKGAVAFFGKPFNRKTLLETVYRTLSVKEERWNTKRDNVVSHLFLQLKAENLDKSILSKMINLGRGGMFFPVSVDQPPVESLVSFNISFDDTSSKSLEGQGIIRWTRSKEAENLPAGCGIEFTYLDTHSRDYVISHINRSNFKAYIPKA